MNKMHEKASSWDLRAFGYSGVLIGNLALGCGGIGETTGDVASRAVPAMPSSGAAGQPNVQLPTFPQQFEVQGPEPRSFGFAVTQPGPVVVDVQAQGAPLIVTLQSPGGQPITQQATGNLRMNYNVTPQEVQRNLFWTLHIRLAQPMPPQQGGRTTGSVTVQYPPINQTAVQQALQSAAAQRRRPTDQDRAQAAAKAKAQMDAGFQAHKAQFEQQRQQRHAVLMAAVQPMITQMQAQAGAALRSRGVEETSMTETAAAPGEEVTSRALLAPTLIVANPTISSLSVSRGQPDDPVMITGSGFGSNAGEVHFVIASGLDVVPTAKPVWTDTQIFTSVPEATGLLAFNGVVYIKRAADQKMSNLKSFGFDPILELRQITATSDRLLTAPVWADASVPLNEIDHGRVNSDWLSTAYGTDQFFVQTRLKPGWSTQNAIVYCVYCDGGAFLLAMYPGSNSPNINIRWWLNPDPPFGLGFSNLTYQYSVHIVGPKGVPDGVVCTQIPCPPS